MSIVIQQQNLKEAFEKAGNERAGLMYVADKVMKEKSKMNMGSISNLKEKQREKLSKFLIKYKPNQNILVKCKKSFQIEDLFFKKDNYYLLTFVGIVKSYEEVPFIIHDIRIIEDSQEGQTYLTNEDSFRIKTKYLFGAFEFINSVGENEFVEDNRYEYVYFDHEVIFSNSDIKKIFKSQKSIYEPCDRRDCE